MIPADADRAEFRRRMAVRRSQGYRSFFDPVTAACVPIVAELAGPGNGRVALDVGCGSGRLAAELRARGFRCLAVDRSPDMLRGAPPAPDAVVADALALPVRTASVDVVCAAFLVAHVDRLDALLGEFHRVLRPGGRVVLANWCAPAESPFNGLLVSTLRRHLRSAELDRSLALSDPAQLSQHLELAGLAPGPVDQVRTTVAIDSATGWLDGLLAGASGLAAALSSCDPPTRTAVRREFLAAAERYAPTGAVAVPAGAFVVAARTRS